MDMFWREITLFFIALSTASCEKKITLFTQDEGLNGIVPTDSSPSVVRTMLDCAVICSSDEGCRGFYYSRTLKECFPEIAVNFTTFQADPAGKYFSKDAPSVQTPTRAILSTTSCPANFTEDILLVGDSGTNYTLKFTLTPLNHTDAIAWCVANGLSILKFNNDVKIQDLTTALRTCPVYSAEDYWTDVEKRHKELGEPWKNSEELEIAPDKWCNGVVGQAEGEYCARLSTSCNYLLKERVCSSLKEGTICE